MNRLLSVQVPDIATKIYINNVGCLRYTIEEYGGELSSCVEPQQMGVYLEKKRHEIIGDTMISYTRYIIIEDKSPDKDV